MDHDDEGYTGPATVLLGDAAVAVTVTLRGHFQPIDGYFHWYGRVDRNDELSALAGDRKRTVVLRTPQGEATGDLADPDPWGRLRVTGISRPPFHVPTSLEELSGRAP